MGYFKSGTLDMMMYGRELQRNGVVGTALALMSATALVYAQRRKRTNTIITNDAKYTVGAATNERIDLSDMQRYLLEAQDKGSDQVVCCVVISGMIPEKEDLYKAVKIAKDKHCVLGSAIFLDSDGKYRLGDEHKLEGEEGCQKYSGSVTIVNDKGWREVADDCINTIQFPKPTEMASTPLWKLVLVNCVNDSENGAVLIFVLNHVMFDGTSRNKLVSEFMRCLDRAKETQSLEDTSFSSVLPLPNRKELSKQVRTASWLRFALRYIQEIHGAFKRTDLTWYYPLEEAPGIRNPEMESRTRQILYSLTESQTKALLDRCKSERTTVHAAFSAAAHRALVLMTVDKGCQTPNSAFFGSGHIISLWRYVSGLIDERTIGGVLISLHTVNICTKIEEDPWEFARNIKADLQKFLPLHLSQTIALIKLRGKCSTIRNMLGYNRDELPQAYKQLMRSGSSFAISNNGVWKFEEQYGATTVESVYACSARHSVPGNLGTFNTQTVRGRLHVGWSYYTHVWSDETAESFVKHFQEELMGMCTQ